MSAAGKGTSNAAKAAPAPAATAHARSTPAAKAPAIQAAGNQQTLNVLGLRSPLSIPVGSPGDAHEREADEVAAKVTADSPLPAIGAARFSAQRKCTSCGGPMPSAPHLPGPGQPLPSSTRAFFEPRFGRDFSNVRVHRYPAASEGSRRIGARAFTLGTDIAFAAGEFSPESASGKQLLAHELTHVVQQEGGRPRVQADGKITEEDLVVIRKWIEMGGSSLGLPDPKLPLPTRSQFHQWRFQVGQATGLDPLTPFGVAPARADYSDVCPNCHQRPWEIRAERQRRQAEWEAKRRQQEREAAWPRMHAEQSKAELEAQAGTLSEDIENSKMALIQMRLELFDRALARKAGTEKGPANSLLTEEIRNHWADAEQATIILESLFEATADELTAEVADRVRGPYRAFYDSLSFLFLRLDFQQKRAEAFTAKIARERTSCPTMSCHQPSRPQFSSFSVLSPQPRPQFGGFLPPAPRKLSSGEELDLAAMLAEPDKGWRSVRLSEAKNRNEAAVARTAWKTVIGDFRWATSIVDEQLRAELWSDEEARGSLEQFQYQQELLARQQRFLQDHPDALKVRAVFYPKDEFTEKADEKGVKTEVAKGIPWQFYLTRTPWDDPTTVPAGYEWQLHDITAPVRPDRTVKKRYQVGMFEALGRERGPWADPKPIMQTDPPRTLYEELDHKDFFPEGELYWISPITGTKDHITTHASRTFGEWLGLIGMTIAILGSLVFPPLSAAMVATALIGTGLSIAGNIHRLAEQKEHGVLTEADVDRFYWNVALDVASALTLGLGKIAVAARAANALRIAQAASRAYIVMKRVNIFIDVVNIGVLTHDFVAQYRAIQNSNMTEEQKKAALIKLAAFSMLAGAMIVVPLRSSLKEWRSGAALHLDVDPGNPSRLVADLEPGAEAASHVATRSSDKAHIVERTSFTHPETGEKHSFAVWSDGRITRCSEVPCLTIAESVLTRLDELRQRMPKGSPSASGLQALAERAKALREEAETLAAGSPKKLSAGTEALLAKARDIEKDMAALEKKLGKETGWEGRLGSEQAVKKVPGGTAGGRVTGAERASGRTQAPLDWPIVKIDPKKPPDVVPDGVVLELPTGERIWRTTGEDRGLVIEASLGPASKRKDFEAAYYSRGEMELPGYVKSDLERAHSQGAGTGFEAMYGIPYAPREVNQELQNLGIEEFFRELQRNRPPGVDFKIVTNTRMHPGTRRLSLIEYSLVAVYNNRRTTLFSTGIRVEGTLEAPIVSIAGDLTYVHPEAAGLLPINDLAETMLERRLDMFARKAAARGK